MAGAAARTICVKRSARMAGSTLHTLSICPEATRQELARLLTYAITFLLARNNLGTPGSLRRLGMVACLNGMALAFAFPVFQLRSL